MTNQYNEERCECSQLTEATRTVQRLAKDRSDLESANEALIGAINTAIIRISRAGFYGAQEAETVAQRLREALNRAAPDEDSAGQQRNPRWFIEAVADALGIHAPSVVTAHDVLEEAWRVRYLAAAYATLHGVVSDVARRMAKTAASQELTAELLAALEPKE